MELNNEEIQLIDKLAEILAKVNTQVNKEQVKRQLASYAEGIKTGVTIASESAQAAAAL